MDEIFLKYHSYLDDDTVKIITDIKNSRLYDLILGKGQTMSTLFNGGEEHYGYYENLPLSMAYKANSRLSPIFYDNNVENINILISYVDDLKALYNTLCKYEKRYGLNMLHYNYAISKLKDNGIGHCNVAKINL